MTSSFPTEDATTEDAHDKSKTPEGKHPNTYDPSHFFIVFHVQVFLAIQNRVRVNFRPFLVIHVFSFKFSSFFSLSTSRLVFLATYDDVMLDRS